MILDLSILRRFHQAAPAYSTYPIAKQFVEAFDAPTLERQIAASNAFGMRRGCALTIHLPAAVRALFKDTVESDVIGNHGWYLHHLEREIRMVGALMANHAVIDQIHWSGGAGALPEPNQARLLDLLRENFEFSHNGMHSADINPFNSALSDLPILRHAGVTRIEIGTQNLASLPADRVRWAERQAMTVKLVTGARETGIESIGVDLVYDGPGQSVASFMRALDELLACGADRVTFRGCIPAKCNSAQFAMLTIGAQCLTDAGYTCIGIDHFVRVGDQLAIAHRLGRLTRLPHGYSSSPRDTVLALGPGAIGISGPTYYQNHRTAADYCCALDQGRLPVMRGLQLTPDDMVRRTVIHSLSTNFLVDIAVIEAAHRLDFHSHFAVELSELAQFAAAGLLSLGDGMITVSAGGYLVLGAICQVFDSYARQAKQRESYGIKQ